MGHSAPPLGLRQSRGGDNFKHTISTENTLAQKVKFVSPFGVAQYPHISAPDTVGKFADGKFKTKLVLPAGAPEAQAFVAKVDAAATEIHGAKGAKMYKPYVIDEDANTVTFTFKTQYAPAIFDSANNAVKDAKIGGGSVIRLLGQFVEFEKGISAQFNQVQIKELNGFGSSGFDAVDDGFVAQQDNSSSGFQADDETAEAATGAQANAALDI